MKMYTVTGGSGFIGYHLINSLGAKTEILIVDREAPHPAILALPHVSFHPCDISEDEIPTTHDDGVFHLAAQPGVKGDPLDSIKSNILGTYRVCNTFDCPVVFCSSGAVYHIPRVPHDVFDRPWSSNYGISKAVGEMYIRSLCDRFCILRFSNVYGFQNKPKAVIGNFITSALSGKDIVIHGDGRQKRDFIHVSNIVEALLKAMDRAEIGVNATVDISTGHSTSIKDLACKIADRAPGASIQFNETENPGALSSAMLPDDAKTVLGWSPSIKLEDGLDSTIEEFKLTS